jgi:hypothetical protein
MSSATRLCLNEIMSSLGEPFPYWQVVDSYWVLHVGFGSDLMNFFLLIW